jgi:acyl-CoA synthetase (AMP-forming)/AMP-acid ligase II
LDRQARSIGALLQGLVPPGERALLLYPPGLEYIAVFFGCLYAGVVAVSAYPPRLNRPDPRLQGIVADSQPAVALTTTPILAGLAQQLAQAPELGALRWLTTDMMAGDLAEAWCAPTLSSSTPALLQYTSGSTAAPRGVVLTHGNLLHNSALIQRCFESTPESRGVFWLPFYHDMGLIGGILQPLYCGGLSTLMSPLAFLQRPLRWLQTISRTRATHSAAPNFAYDLCARRIRPEQRAALDLSSWRLAANGSEPIRHDTLERFAAAFEPCGFRREAFEPCYGLAEATLFVSGGSRSGPPIVQMVRGPALEENQVVAATAGDKGARALVSCGRVPPDQRVMIVDPGSFTRCAPDQIGEIWVSGPSVAKGYWGRLEETEQTFHAYLADTSEGPFLRTGDLGYMEGGQLFVVGRLKDLIIIRGRNHHPEDIEHTVEQSHPALRPGCGAVVSVDTAAEERLVVIHEVERRYRDLDVDEVVGAIRQAVAEQHELQVQDVVLLKTGSIPKTSSGKIQRHACRAGLTDGSLEVWGQERVSG